MRKLLFLLLLISKISFAQVNLTSGLVGYYPFNGNANDISGNNINGTVNNATLTTDRTGQVNGAYYFNGSNSSIKLPFSNLYNFAPSGNFSLSVWIQPDLNNSWPAQAIVVKSPYNADFYQSNWNYGIYNFNYKMMTGFAANNVLVGTTTFTTNQCWYNLIVTYSNGKWAIYVNGNLEGSDNSQTRYILQDNSSEIFFGKKGESDGDFYQGKMDEVRIYNRVLNQQEITAISQDHPCIPECIATNSINIASGYNANTNTYLTQGQKDSNWVVTDMSLKMQNALCYGSSLSTGPPPSNILYPPVPLNQYSYGTDGPIGFISCYPYVTLYTKDQPSIPNSGAFEYTMNVRRNFYVESNNATETVFFNFTITCDDAIDSVIIDKGTPNQVVVLNTLTKTVGAGTPYNVSKTISLSPGAHTIDIKCLDWQDPVNGDYYPVNGQTSQYQWNPFGVKVIGTITSTNNVLQNKTCCTTTYRTIDTTICQGKTFLGHSTSGQYKDTIPNATGCDSIITTKLTVNSSDFDFSYSQDICNPLSVQFFASGNNLVNPIYIFGDNSPSLTNNLNPIHLYANLGNYLVKFSAQNNNVCKDTIEKTIAIITVPANIIKTNDTTICYGTSTKLQTQTALDFCWSPTTYLDNPSSPTPITSTPKKITYYLTAKVPGNNLIKNGDFNLGNTAFTSSYDFSSNNITEGQYFVGTNPQAWNPGMSTSCVDHTGTSGNGNQLLVNGSPSPNIIVWSQVVPVTSNTNYAFSAWVQNLAPTIYPNSILQFSINGNLIGTNFNSNTNPCIWDQFYATWNSGTVQTATIAIVNNSLVRSGNDFALDDISFAPVQILKDSVIINVDTPSVKVNKDTTVCEGSKITLNATGASSYVWGSVTTGLSDPTISNPIATINAPVQYIVTGTDANKCTASATINIGIASKPIITKMKDSSICKNSSIQLFASGGTKYSWLPSSSLDNTSISTPIATPTAPTKYYVTVSNPNNCTNTDSINISFKPTPTFSVSPNGSICGTATQQLNATGGDTYSWTPATGLNNAGIRNPVASPAITTQYTVHITSLACNESVDLPTTVTVGQSISVKAEKSNDIDCLHNAATLSATGAVKYEWTPSNGLSNPKIANPIAKPTATKQYIVKGTNADGCVGYDTIVVSAIFNPIKGDFIPNAFTPNGDGKNDCYRIPLGGPVSYFQLSIYNRFGEKVFYSENPSDCWDGYYKGQITAGTYVYYLNAKTACGQIDTKGNILLVQ